MGGRRLFQKLAWFASAILGLGSWIAFLWPLGLYLQRPLAPGNLRPDVTDALVELSKINNLIYPFPFGGYLLLATSLIPLVVAVYVAIAILRYIENSYVSISVLETHLTLTFHDDLLENSSLVRKQTLHANRPDVSAYHLKSGTNSERGTLLDERILFDAFINNRPITQEILKFGKPNKRELVEIYQRPLPISLLATLAPNSLVLWAHRQGMFKKTVVERTGIVVHHNEYVGPEPELSIDARPYPCTVVTIVLDFPLVSAPTQRDVRAFLVNENVGEAISIIPSVSYDRVRYEIRWRNFHQSSIRVRWKNRRLDRHRRRLGLPSLADAAKLEAAKKDRARRKAAKAIKASIKREKRKGHRGAQ